MTAGESSREHERSCRTIAAHFAGGASPAAETAMRAHLPTCNTCRRRYERHLILARLDPQALSAQQRIARGLGFRVRGPSRRSYWFAGLALPVALAASVLVLPNKTRHAAGGDASHGFAARGSEQRGEPRAPALWMYRVNADGGPRLVDHTIRANDELAFAYSNPSGRTYLMIFGVDEHRHVYWFHPGWPSGQPAPAAIRAIQSNAAHELPEAIRHAFDGQRLRVYALFSEQSLTATTIETWVHDTSSLDAVQRIAQGVVPVQRTLEVLP
jgi:hypothetical protein